MATNSLPSTMKAIVINGTTASVSSSRPLPKLRDSYILVKVHSIALNPTDWKHIASGAGAPNGLSGCDYSGTVVNVGSAVTKSCSPGDRICGCAHGANQDQPEDGVFAEYAMVKGDVQMKIPDGLSFEQAATFPLGVGTVAQGLYQKALKLKLPTEPTTGGEWVLIYGGSTATGSLGVQFAKASGYKVVSTASPRNHAFVTSLGADAVFDYNSPTCAQDIKALTNNSLTLAWDTISLKDSAAICADALSDSSSGEKCKYGTILPIKPPRDDLEVTSTIMYTIFNETFVKWGNSFDASKEDFEFARMFMGITEQMLKEGKLKTHPEQVGKGGLEGALVGMQDMKAEKVSGKKLVYRVGETPEGSEASVDLA